MVDVTVYGAGIMGLSAAWSCARRGAKVRVIDPNGPASGASGGLVGALAPHMPENWNEKKQFQLESLILAEEYWAGIVRKGGVSPGFSRSGRLQVLADTAAVELAQKRAGDAAQRWGDAAKWEVLPVSEFDGWCPVSPSGQVIQDTLSARLHPRRACQALVAALRHMQVPIEEDGPESGRIIHATGAAGLDALSQEAGRQIGRGIKGQAAVLDYRAPAGASQIFAEGLHIVPHAGGGVAIGSTTERDYDDPLATDGQIDALIEKAISVLPELKGAAVLERWAALRPRARSRAPIVGPYPGRRGHFILNGGFKIGFGMAPKLAETLADLVLHGTDTIPEGFRPEKSFG